MSSFFFPVARSAKLGLISFLHMKSKSKWFYSQPGHTPYYYWKLTLPFRKVLLSCLWMKIPDDFPLSFLLFFVFLEGGFLLFLFVCIIVFCVYLFLNAKTNTGAALLLQSIVAGVLLALGLSAMAVLKTRYRWTHLFCIHNLISICFVPQLLRSHSNIKPPNQVLRQEPQHNKKAKERRTKKINPPVCPNMFPFKPMMFMCYIVK